MAINVCSGFINVIGEAIIVEMSNTQNSSKKKSAAKNLSSYLSITGLSMLISSYLGGFLLEFLSIKRMFLLSSILPITTIIAGVLIKEKGYALNNSF